MPIRAPLLLGGVYLRGRVEGAHAAPGISQLLKLWMRFRYGKSLWNE